MIPNVQADPVAERINTRRDTPKCCREGITPFNYNSDVPCACSREEIVRRRLKICLILRNRIEVAVCTRQAARRSAVCYEVPS